MGVRRKILPAGPKAFKRGDEAGNDVPATVWLIPVKNLRGRRGASAVVYPGRFAGGRSWFRTAKPVTFSWFRLFTGAVLPGTHTSRHDRSARAHPGAGPSQARTGGSAGAASRNSAQKLSVDGNGGHRVVARGCRYRSQERSTGLSKKLRRQRRQDGGHAKQHCADDQGG